MTNTEKNTQKPQQETLAIPSQKPSNKPKANIPNIDVAAITGEETGTKTLGSMMGEIVWLMSQSLAHKHLSLADLEWVLMPPIILNQYKLFREGNKPVGAALWGYLNEEAEARLAAAGRLAPQDWGNNAQLDQDQGLVPTEGGTLWLVELITPFHTEQNKHREQMLGDLMQTAFKGKKVKMFRVNPLTGKREELSLG